MTQAVFQQRQHSRHWFGSSYAARDPSKTRMPNIAPPHPYKTILHKESGSKNKGLKEEGYEKLSRFKICTAANPRQRAMRCQPQLLVFCMQLSLLPTVLRPDMNM